MTNVAGASQGDSTVGTSGQKCKDEIEFGEGGSKRARAMMMQAHFALGR